MTRPPKNWGEDGLSKFIQIAHENQYATFDNMKPIYSVLSRIDNAFTIFGTDLVDPGDVLSAALLYRSHSAYRGACRMAISTQVVDAFPLVRSCLEYAGYARLIFGNSDLGFQWLKRHDDAESMRRVKREFTQRSIRQCIKSHDADLASSYDVLYQRAIDFGAHPNERALTASMTILKGDGKTFITQNYLHGDGAALDHVLRTTSQAGLIALRIFEQMFEARFSTLGLKSEIQELCHGL